MKTAIRFFGLLLTLVAGTTTGLQAQKLAPGTWTGKGVDPGGEEFPSCSFACHSESTSTAS